MEKVRFKNNEFETEHEAICSAIFDKYGWRWERPKHDSLVKSLCRPS